MSNEARRTRAILPRAPPGNDQVPPHSTQRAPLEISRINTQSSPRTNISSACIACRRRRSKCTGGNPCGLCRRLATECNYNESQDGRTSALRGKSREELELYRKVFGAICQADNDTDLQGIFNLIRSGASLETVAATIDSTKPELSGDSGAGTPETQLLSAHEQTEHMETIYDTTDRRKVTVDPTQSMTRTAPQMFISEDIGETTSSSAPYGKHLSGPAVGWNEAGMWHKTGQPSQEWESGTQHLGTLYTTYRDVAKQMLVQGVPPVRIFGGPKVSCHLLFNSQQPSFDISTWAYIIVSSVPGTDVLFRLAWLCYITRFMKWAIEPSEEHARLMPPAMMPTRLQWSREHPAGIDLVPIPRIRDQMIENFRDFTSALEIAGATVLWAESIEDAIEVDQQTGNITVSERFETYISNTNNFCFGRSLLDIFPELNGEIQVAEQEQIMSVSAGTPMIPSIDPDIMS